MCIAVRLTEAGVSLQLKGPLRPFRLTGLWIQTTTGTARAEIIRNIILRNLPAVATLFINNRHPDRIVLMSAQIDGRKFVYK